MRVCCVKENNASEGNSAGLLFPDYSDIKPPTPLLFFFFLVFSQLLLVSFPIYYGIPICIYYKCSYIKTIIILTENYAHNWKILEFAFVFLTLLKYS